MTHNLMKRGIRKNTYKLCAVILSLFICCLVLGGCDSGVKGDSGVMVGQELSGGDEGLGKGVNLKEIGIEMQGTKAVINMSFIKGSRVEGAPETMISSVPAYTISLLTNPARLKVQLDVSYMDSAGKNEIFTDSVVYGMFKAGEPGTQGFSVYFQLNDNVRASALENDSVLSISLEPERGTPRKAFFAGLDAFAEYEAGELKDGFCLTPTMCDGLTDVMLISGAYTDRESAQKKAEEINSTSGLPQTQQAYVFEMDTDARPVLERQQSSNTAGGKPVIGADDKEFPLPVLIENGEYLCTTPSGDIIFYRQVIPTAGQETELVLKYEIFSMDADGKEKKMDIPELYGVDGAQVSPSGKYLAILEDGISDRVLYVYDFATGTLQNLGEEGFGNITSSFVWDEREDVIYAMTGFGDMQLTEYDYALPEGERVSSVEEKNGAESAIAISGDKLYFADQQVANGRIYSVDIGTAERAEIAPGVGFVLAPNGRLMAARTNVVAEEGSPSSNLDIIDLQTGETKSILKNEIVEDVAFDANSGVLYYTTQTYDGARGEFPYAFLKYTLESGQTDFLGYSKTGTFIPGPETGEIYIIDYFEQDDAIYPVTYVYSENQ